MYEIMYIQIKISICAHIQIGTCIFICLMRMYVRR